MPNDPNRPLEPHLARLDAHAIALADDLIARLIAEHGPFYTDHDSIHALYNRALDTLIPLN